MAGQAAMGEAHRVRDTNMTGDDLAQLVARGYELRGVEFKGPGRRDDKHFFSRVARAVLGMSNNRDGGIIVLGVAEEGTLLCPLGLSPEQLTTWAYDDVVAGLSKYADPPANFDLEHVEMDASSYVVLRVHEFDDVPILCAKNFTTENGKFVLRQGACYVRSRGRRETTEIPTQAEMRDLLDLAAEKRLRAHVAMSQREGVVLGAESRTTSKENYARELEDIS